MHRYTSSLWNCFADTGGALSATDKLIAQNKNNNLERFYCDFLQKWAALFFVRLLGLFIGLISSGESILFMFY